MEKKDKSVYIVSSRGKRVSGASKASARERVPAAIETPPLEEPDKGRPSGKTRRKKLIRALIIALCVVAVLSGLYLTAVYSQIPFIEKWRTLYIETAMSTLSHHWLAEAFIPQSVIDKVMEDVTEQLEDNLIEESQLPPGRRPTSSGSADGTPSPEDDPTGLLTLMALFYELDESTLPDSIEDFHDLQIKDIESLGIKTTAGDAVWAIDAPNGILILTVKGEGYVGKLAIVRDSSQVILGSKIYETRGRTVTEFCSAYGAVLGVNANGFVDPDGIGRGEQPVGLIIEDGEIVNPRVNGYNQVAGLDYDNNFRVGNKLDLTQLRYAMEFYPIVILNGEAVANGSYGMGIQPRTVVGQTYDKSMLFLVIDGRQLHSLGTTVSECVSILQRYDCFNAMNMDGGSSSSMTYMGEMITKTSSPKTDGRYLPSAWLVLPK